MAFLPFPCVITWLQEPFLPSLSDLHSWKKEWVPEGSQTWHEPISWVLLVAKVLLLLLMAWTGT